MLATLSTLLALAGTALAQATVQVPLGQLTFTGAWAVGNDPQCGAYHWTNIPGASASYTFSGTAWTMAILQLPTSGNTRETMDGGTTWATQDFLSNPKQCTGNGFSANALTAGKYTVQIQHVGPTGTGTYISAFSYVSLPASASLSATLSPAVSLASVQSTESIASTQSLASLSSLSLTTTASVAASTPTSSLSRGGKSNDAATASGASSHSISSGAIAGITLAIILGGLAIIYALWRCLKDPEEEDEYWSPEEGDTPPPSRWAAFRSRFAKSSAESPSGEGVGHADPEMSENKTTPV